MLLQQFLAELFEATPNYSLLVALEKLRGRGGISSLLNSLTIDHRQITNIYKTNKYSSSSQAQRKDECQKKKKLPRKQPQLENILLYLITLSFFVKLLLFDHGIRENLNIYTEVISFAFLIFIIAQKKSRTKPENVERTLEFADNQRMFKVRRKGEQTLMQYEKIVQGDIVYLQEGDSFKFDGIILEIVQNSREKDEQESSFVTVNEEEVGTGRSKCKKHPIWKVDEGYLQDPFLLANSIILSGSMWVLVCLVSKINPSKRNNSEIELGGLLKLSNISHQVEQIMRLAVVMLVAYLSLVWMSVETMNSYNIFLQLIYLISCLTLYLSYANTSEILSNLKKFLKQKILGNGYKILNHKLLERLGEVDLVIIQDDCLSKNVELLTKINSLIDLKIVTHSSPKDLQGRFGGDLNHELIYESTDNKILRSKLDQLEKSKFISMSYENFRSYYLQILRDLKYCMVYMSRSRAAIGKYEDIITVKCSDMNVTSDSRLQGEWIRISQGANAEEILLDVIEKARLYKRFQESYYTVVINNCLELSMLIGWALSGCLVDLNLNLLIIFTNRNRVKQFYEALAEQNEGARYKVKGLLIPIQVNLILFAYYLYINFEIYQSNNRQFQLFLVLMANRMFRIEALIRQKNIKPLISRLLLKSLIIFGLIMMEAFLKWELGHNSDFVSESLDILLLPLILLIFVLFL